MERKLLDHVVFPSEHEAVAVTLWIAATHAQPAWDHATRLIIKSPIKRCGKSRLLDLAYGLAHDVLMTTNVSVAALVHSIGDKPNDPPTILVDEADTIFGRGRWAEGHEDLRNLLNAGYARNRPYIRWDPKRQQREDVPTFAMAALAGIGKLPDTIEDRAVVINMRRRRPDEKVQPFRIKRDVPALEPLQDELAKWVREQLLQLKQAAPAMALEDREADVWESLLAIADLAGGEWPERARRAAGALTQGAEEDEAELLLLHIFEAFQADGSGKLKSHDLCEALYNRADAPWAAMWSQWVKRRQTPGGVWEDDFTVVASKLAGLLKPFGITSTKVKFGGVALQGYREADFADTWARLGIAGTAGTRRTRLVKPVRPGTGAGTSPEPGDSGSDQVPPMVLATSALARRVPSVPVVPAAPSRRLRRVQ